MKRLFSLIILVALVYLGYQWYHQGQLGQEQFSITGEVSGNVMLLGKSVMEVTEQKSRDKYYVYSEDCCAEKGETYTFFIESSEVARVNERSLTLYTESKRVQEP